MSEMQVASAKLTLHLHVTGVREDGYHIIDSEMTSVSLVDRLWFDEGNRLTVGGCAASSVTADEDNLVCRALQVVGKTADVYLEKNIPPGGGLGGGSSDAAAVLRWAKVTDLSVAARIGADVPFCVIGGRARVKGIGEVLEPLEFVHRTYTLLTPPFAVSTPAVYRVFDELRADGSGMVDMNVANHLQAAAIAVEPRLAQWRDFMAESTGVQPVLAGSGSTWFVEGAFEQPSAELLHNGCWNVVETTPPIALDQ